MPRIIIQANRGRTLDQKRGLVKGVTEAVCANFDVTPDQVTILFHEFDEENRAKGGVMAADQVATPAR